jgi:hypothetical protein
VTCIIITTTTTIIIIIIIIKGWQGLVVRLMLAGTVTTTSALITQQISY